MNTEWELAARTGDADLLESKLGSGASVDSRDRHGQTALMLAAQAGHERACRVLIDAGADLNVTAKFGLSALMLAVLGHHEQVAREIARAGADLTSRGTGAPGFAGKTAAGLAREGGLFELADELSC